jgi:hypothetical protein
MGSLLVALDIDANRPLGCAGINALDARVFAPPIRSAMDMRRSAAGADASAGHSWARLICGGESMQFVDPATPASHHSTSLGG